MKLLLAFDKGKELIKEEVICVIFFRSDGTFSICGQENIPLDRWDTLARQLPGIVRQEHKEEKHGN